MNHTLPTREEYTAVKDLVWHKRNLKRYTNSTIAIYRDSILELYGRKFNTLYFIKSLRMGFTYEETIKELEEHL